MNATRQLVEIVVPLHNEKAVLEANIRLLLDHLRSEYPIRFTIVVADNAGTDSTPAIPSRLELEEPGIRWLRLERRGPRARAPHRLARKRGRRQLGGPRRTPGALASPPGRRGVG